MFLHKHSFSKNFWEEELQNFWKVQEKNLPQPEAAVLYKAQVSIWGAVWREALFEILNYFQDKTAPVKLL